MARDVSRAVAVAICVLVSGALSVPSAQVPAGQAAFEAGRLEEAIAAYSRALDANPDDRAALIGRARVRLQVRDFRAAITDLSRILERTPADVVALNNRGYAWQQLDSPAQALRDFERALQIDPKNIYALTHHAELLESMGDTSGARADYIAVLAIDPTHASAAAHATALTAGPKGGGAGGPVPGGPARPAAPRANWELKPQLPADLKGLTRAHSTGLGASLAAGMEVLTGAPPGSNTSFNALMDFVPPGAEEAGAAHAELLGKALALKGAQGTALASADQAWQEAVIAAQYGNEEATREALAIVQTHVETVQAAKTGIVKISDLAKQLPPIPDAALEKAKANEEYRRLLARSKATILSDSGLPGTTGGQPGYKLVSAEIPPNRAYPDPARENKFSGNATQVVSTRTVKDATATYASRLEWTVPERLVPGQPARFRISGSASSNSAQQAGIYIASNWIEGSDPMRLHRPIHLCGVRMGGWYPPDKPVPDVFDDAFEFTVPDLGQALQNLRAGKGNVNTKLNVRKQQDLEDIVFAHEDGRYAPQIPSALPLVDVEYRYRADGEWTADPQSHQIAPLRIMVHGGSFGNSLALYTYKWVDDVDGGQQVAVNDPPVPDVPPDKVAEVRLHQANIRLIQAALAKDEAELAGATTQSQRQALEWRILHDKSDLLAEQDLIASIEQGTIVHTRSPFDDYAHDRFVETMQKENAANFDKKRAAIAKLLALVPDDQRPGMQAFVDRQLTPDVLGSMNHAKLREVANLLSGRVQNYWQGESAKATDQALKYDDYITRAERVKFISDVTVTVGSMGGSGFLYKTTAGYATGMGLATKGPLEAVSQAAMFYDAPLHAALEAMKAYPEGGVWGAGKAAAIGYVMARFTQLGNPEGKAEGVVAAEGAGAAKPGQVAAAEGAGAAKPAQVAAAEGQAVKLTAAEEAGLKKFEEAKAKGRELVEEYKKARDAMVAAREAGRPVAEVRALERQVMERAAAVQTDTHAKALLKYGSDKPVQNAFIESIDELHARVEAQFHQIMEQGRGWTPQQLKPVRNANSAGSVNMDFDIGLVEGAGMRFAQNGKDASKAQWLKDAQQAWNEAFKEITGREAGHAMEQVTTTGAAEAYKDMAWIGNDVEATSQLWARQAGDVTRYKAQEILSSTELGAVDYYTRLMEAARGTAKDLGGKLLPRLEQLKSRIPGPGGPARQQALLDKWKQIQKVMEDIGQGRIDPVHGDRQIRAMTGGYSIPEVIDHGATLLGEVAKMTGKVVR